MQSKAKTVTQYLKELPADRRKAIQAVRTVVLKNLPDGYEEGMQYGMIGYYVPHRLYPAGYHCDPSQPLPYAHLASQKNHMAIYLFGMYSDPDIVDWFVEEYKKSGKKLDMGKSCVRFKKLDDLPLEIVGKVIKKISVKKMIATYEASIDPKKLEAAKKKAAAKKSAAKKKATKKPAKKQTARKKNS